MADSYMVRVNFPDDDLYTFVTSDDGMNKGQVKIFTDLHSAEAVAKQYIGGM